MLTVFHKLSELNENDILENIPKYFPDFHFINSQMELLECTIRDVEYILRYHDTNKFPWILLHLQNISLESQKHFYTFLASKYLLNIAIQEFMISMSDLQQQFVRMYYSHILQRGVVKQSFELVTSYQKIVLDVYQVSMNMSLVEILQHLKNVEQNHCWQGKELRLVLK